MRLGVLDIGSNSAQLQIVDLAAGSPPLPAHAVKNPTLLSEEINDDGVVSAAGIERVSQSVSDAVRVATEQHVDQLYPFVTAAIRDAVNRDEVLDRIEAVAGVRPQFLTGEQEARLTYLAVHRWFGWSSGRLLLLDIGGGSMEVALGRDAAPSLALSLPLGVRRLTSQFLASDPPSGKQVKQVRRHIRDTLGEVADRLRWEAGPRRVVATSKTFKQLARLTGAPPQRKGPFVRRTISLDDLRTWIPRLAELPAKERADLRGISSSRAKQILAGALVAETTMAVLDVKSTEVCPWALREGIMLRHQEALTTDTDLPLYPLERVRSTSEHTNVATLPTARPTDQA
jgi:exopolyphosphatase / guanosine-5'-triphosphate,3'-diphosphate pyrophosphatase